RPCAEFPLVTGCALAVELALRPVVEGAGDAGALGVTVAAGVDVELVVGVEPPPPRAMPRPGRSPTSRTPLLPRILSSGDVLDCSVSLSFSGTAARIGDI